MQDNENRETERRVRFINMWDTFKMYSALVGRYYDFCMAFARTKVEEGLDKGRLVWKNPRLHDDFVREIEGDVRAFCGEHFGENPRLATHPIMQKLMETR